MTSPYYPPPGQQPGYPPQQPAYPPQSYPPPQQQPQYAPQQPAYYPPPQQQPQYAPPPSSLDIDDFYDQPAASGKSISGWFQTPGQSITGVVARAISKADIRPQTDMQTKQPLPPRADGSVRSTMAIPLLVQPSPDFPDGRASFIVGPSDRPDLEVAMQAAGCKPKTVPEAGAVITVTYVGPRQIPGFGAPKKVKTITYQRPANAGAGEQAPPAPAPAPVAQPQFEQPVQQQYAPQPPATYPNGQYLPQQPYQAPPQQPAQYAPQPPPFQAPYQPQPDPTPYATAPAPGPAPATPAAPATAAYAAPDTLTPEQAERLRQLTGGQ